MAAVRGGKVAVVANHGRPARFEEPLPYGRGSVQDRVTFSELEALSNRYANGLAGFGIARGMRTLVMVRPGIEFVGMIFALFKIGAVPVMIDPGMGVGRMLECIQQVDLHAFVGIPIAHVMRLLRPEPFRTANFCVTVGRRWGWGGASLDELAQAASDRYVPAATRADEPAAILFTSGSTGPAKGVVYEHGMFDAQVRMIRDAYGIEPGEVDLPAFPLFVLFSVAMGMTAVIPEMDPSRPARVDPAKFVRAIQEHRVTNTFGSPAIWNRVAPYCAERGTRLPSIRRILIAGAPVPWRVIEQLRSAIGADADVYTPYGATEALPVSSIRGAELADGLYARSLRGAGTCVGRPLPGTEVRIIRILDDPIVGWSAADQLPHGEIGEIVVRGPSVTRAYFGQETATAAAKIADGDSVWHRMGDVGYLDADGRLWFCGRKSQRVEAAQGTLFTECCEPVFNQHPAVFRSALVGVGRRGEQEPVIIVEPRTGLFPKWCNIGRGCSVALHGRRIAADKPRRYTKTALVAELLALAKEVETTRGIRRVLFHKTLPVDVRHNAKIHREALAEWAARKLR